MLPPLWAGRELWNLSSIGQRGSTEQNLPSWSHLITYYYIIHLDNSESSEFQGHLLCRNPAGATHILWACLQICSLHLQNSMWGSCSHLTGDKEFSIFDFLCTRQRAKDIELTLQICLYSEHRRSLGGMFNLCILIFSWTSLRLARSGDFRRSLHP